MCNGSPSPQLAVSSLEYVVLRLEWLRPAQDETDQGVWQAGAVLDTALLLLLLLLPLPLPLLPPPPWLS